MMSAKSSIKALVKRVPGLHRLLVYVWYTVRLAARRYAELIFIYFAKRNVIYHLGVYGVGANAGDDVLYQELEKICDKILGKPLQWHHRFIGGEVSRFEVHVINKVAAAVIVGGHGLMMVDTHKNPNSGWQFNITIQNLERLRVPLIIAAVGYNVFREQGAFQPIFDKHIAKCIEKSAFFGLRNYGSIDAVRRHVPVPLHEKVSFQPCPTTLVRHYYPERGHMPSCASKKVGICLAFDRLQNRFQEKHMHVFSALIDYAEWLQTEYQAKIQFFVHTAYDIKQKELCAFFADRGWPLIAITDLCASEVFSFYQPYSLIVGMRGHSLMIPFGLGIPTLSLTTQNKQRWFIETLERPEWSIEATDPMVLDQLKAQTTRIFDDPERVQTHLRNMQNQFVSITENNVRAIANSVASQCGASRR